MIWWHGATKTLKCCIQVPYGSAELYEENNKQTSGNWANNISFSCGFVRSTWLCGQHSAYQSWIQMLRDQPAVPADRTSVSEKSLTDNLHLLLFFHRIHCCPLLFHSKSCKTVPERQSMRAHFSPTANQWNSTNSTVICILHLPCVPPLPYLSMSPPSFSLSLFLLFQLGLTIVLQVMAKTA